MRFPRERRRSPRLTLEVPVRVKWHDSHGTLQEETSHTAVLNRHGALLYLSRPLPPDTMLRLTNLSNGRVAFSRVVWTGDTLSDGRARVGIELTQSVGYEFWGTLAVHLWEEEQQAPRLGWFTRLRNWLGSLGS